MSPPRSLARLQLHAGFTFDDAAQVVPYYARLGVSHLYASPILRARLGSTHGYDVVDCNEVSSEIGGEEGLRRLVGALREHGMGLVVDIVPNHMGTGPENAWWMDVLRHGRDSRYAGHFDIDWQSPDPLLRGRLLLPVLGAGYEQTLRESHLHLVRRHGEWMLRLYDDYLPLSPASVRDLTDDAPAQHDPGNDEGRARLHALIEKQHYRLAFWKLASDMVNYRRFFDINDLVGLRIERTAVFEDTHRTIFRLYAEGLIDGVRCDHVDGLADPRRYCRQLRHRFERLRSQRPKDAPHDAAYIVVEKILAEEESLRSDWRVDGTTGYEFMDQVSAVLHDEEGEAPLSGLWRSLTGDGADFATQAVRARRQILVDSFESELERTARALFASARASVVTRDVSLAAIRRVLVELLVHFPVYRTYAGGAGRDAVDEAVFARAVEGAQRTVRGEDADLLYLVATWLGGEAPRSLPPGPVRRARERAIAVFQQATSPVAAKAVEDTAGYRYGRLLSRNEVGVDAAHLALAVEAFHRFAVERVETFPHTLLTTATHDHKRGEDLRARLAVLSEVAARWVPTVERWRMRHEAFRRRAEGRMAPSAADELMLYQMLVGAWPFDLEVSDEDGLEAFATRIAAWQRKALREAKRWTRWTSPNEPYEDACEDFLRAMLSGEAAAELRAFASYIAVPGVANALAQVVLRLTMPGVPDLYQGTDYWDFSLVDPDNRRPVDFEARSRSMARNGSPLNALAGWHDGVVKQAVIHRLLCLRKTHPALFAQGGYRPVEAQGPGAGHALAFLREHRGRMLFVAVGRHLASWLAGADTPEVPVECWEGTTLALPERAWRGVLVEGQLEGGVVPAAAVFGGLPVAVWEAGR